VHRDIIMSLFVQLNAQLDCSRSVKTYTKMLPDDGLLNWNM